MLVVLCPTCRFPLSVHEAQAGQVVACPTCHNPLTAPSLAPTPTPPTPAGEPCPFEVPDGPARPGRSQPRPRAGPSGVAACFLFVVGTLVAVVMILVISDRLEARQDRKRLDALRSERLVLTGDIQSREIELDQENNVGPDTVRRSIYEQDAGWRKLSDRKRLIEAEMALILKDHPDWR